VNARHRDATGDADGWLSFRTPGFDLATPHCPAKSRERKR
jgi:hypothetical protein